MERDRGIADIHNHLIPAVDDGSRSLAETVRHLRAWADDGVTRVAVTPHLNGKLALEPGRAELRMTELTAAFDALRTAIDATPGLPALHFGQEIYLPSVGVAEALIATGMPFGYAGTRWALIEFGFELPRDVPDVIRRVAETGRRPIVSHPERYRRAGEPVGIEEIAAWREAGACLQVNGGSLLGGYRPGAEELAWELIARGWTELVGSDSHADYRPLDVGRVRTALESRGIDTALLMRENPNRVLDDLELLPLAATGI